MFGLGFTEILVILVLVLILFGAGKLPEVMGDLGKGLKSFKNEMDGKKASGVRGQVSGKKPVKKAPAKKKPAKRKK
jgi:sec-independent protein translocase protein TatA